MHVESAPEFNTDDKVCMILDLSNRTLSYQVNDGDSYIAFIDITVGADIEYCMCVYISRSEDGIELLSCELLQ